MSGYTDSDTVFRIGRMLNADCIISGYIRSLGSRNLVITTIVNVETFEQLAGDYREYSTIEEIRALLPEITNRLINALRYDTSRLPTLAIAPFYIANTVINTHDAETLAQILAVEISNTRRYAVLPRTSTMQAAIIELEFQMSGATSDEEAKALGQAVNAELVLNAEVRSLGGDNMFTASILHVEDGSLLAGGYRTYHSISDGSRLMIELALILTDPRRAEEHAAAREAEEKALVKEAEEKARAEVEQRQREQSVREAQDLARQKQQKKEDAKANIIKKMADHARRSKRNGWEMASVSVTMEDGFKGDVVILWSALIGGFYFPSLPYTTIGLESRFSFNDFNKFTFNYFSGSPLIGVSFPIGKTVQLFGDGFIEMGYFGNRWKGLFFDWATPGFDTGIQFAGKGAYLNIKYRGHWFRDCYTHNIGVGFGVIKR